MDSDIRFGGDDLQSSSSDSEYDENEKRLLNKYKKSRHQDSESETEVLGLGLENADDESDDDDKSDIALSDIEGQEPDKLPDIRAWGKDKRNYYGTDYVDPDYGGFDGKDAQNAEIEGGEAEILQNQLAQHLDDGDFVFANMFKKKEEQELKKNFEQAFQKDVSELTNKQKIKILEKETPEFFGLIEDFKAKLKIAKDYLKPAIERIKQQNATGTTAAKFVETYYILILNYATNINMYFVLKGNNQLNNHPIIKSLYQYKQFLSQMDPIFEDVVKQQIELLLEDDSGQKTEEEPKEMKNFLKILSKDSARGKKKKSTGDSTQTSKKIKIDPNIEQGNKKKVTFAKKETNFEFGNKEDNIDEMEGTNKDVEESEEAAKRGITYQISKNKGLTPRRKKEFRNPRVKHKLKYRKALIRRKGAVREPRKELSRYSGEISGIKASLSKSIKIKS